MGCCSAVNCSNSSDSNSSKRRRLFRFPVDAERRQRWIQNCGRERWKINRGAWLCEDHFEASQFESNRADGWRKLKPNAIPTIFTVPNPPKQPATTRVDIDMPKAESSEGLGMRIEELDALSAATNDKLMQSENADPPDIKFNWRLPGPSNMAESPESHKIDLTLPEAETSTSSNTTVPVTSSAEQGKKRKFYLGDFAVEDMSCPSKARKVFRIAHQNKASSTRKIKTLSLAKSRLKKRVASLKKQLIEARMQLKTSDSTSKVSELFGLLKRIPEQRGNPTVTLAKEEGVTKITSDGANNNPPPPTPTTGFYAGVQVKEEVLDEQPPFPPCVQQMSFSVDLPRIPPTPPWKKLSAAPALTYSRKGNSEQCTSLLQNLLIDEKWTQATCPSETSLGS